jgi:hypothetical protein
LRCSSTEATAGRLKIALACQDGQEHLPIPWDEIAAVFIGGSTAEMSDHLCPLIAAKHLDKWVHVGRVNHPERFQHFEQLALTASTAPDLPATPTCASHCKPTPPGVLCLWRQPDIIGMVVVTMGAVVISPGYS